MQVDVVYKTKSGEEIKENKTIKDLGVLTMEDESFAEHIDDIVQSNMIKAGIILRTFETREAQPMMKMFDSFIQSKWEYCSLIWNPHKKEDIDKIERIQKFFTSKIRGVPRKKERVIPHFKCLAITGRHQEECTKPHSRKRETEMYKVSNKYRTIIQHTTLMILYNQT